ncbi:sugar ABC transporter ATP-binding protein [Microbacterium sp. NPDC055910]|uniref:sugar ABC transporter ATP-binding protein n=1 Tax=Microbacterium sp. NPDC055910 TaxID=3345659 RepID=UPI0035E2A487
MAERAASPATGLVCTGLTKRYGGVTVVKDIDITLTPGSVLGLVGENGAGKSTTSGMIAGLVQPDEGSMMIDGEVYDPRSPGDALRSGVVLIHQEIRMVPELSVAENIFIGRLPLKRGAIDRDRLHADTEAVLSRLGSRMSPRQRVGDLSIAAQQEIEIARALSRDPRYIIFDEPSASLGKSETARVFDQIEALKAAGAGIVYISHRIEEITRLSDAILCLRDGHEAARWDTGDVPRDDIVRAMVGRDFTYGHDTPPPAAEKTVIQVSGLGREGAFEGIDFEVRAGEILGIAGLVGAGRSEVVRAIAGADRADTGEIRVDGKVVRIRNPRDGIKAGIAMVPEDRKSQGLLLDRDSTENMTLPWQKQLSRRGIVTHKELAKTYREHRAELDIRGQADVAVGRLSGGNQQKVLLAKWLIEKPKVLILDEPTRGVDVGAKMTIYAAIGRLAEEGVAVIVVSSELEEVLGLSHRVLVMSGGRQQGILDREAATPEAVMRLALPQHAETAHI